MNCYQYNRANPTCSSFHYHVFGGVFLAYAVYSPTYGALSPYIRGTIRDDPTFLLLCTAVFLVRLKCAAKGLCRLTVRFQFAELSNGKTHLILRDLRPAGTKQRGIPHGYGFNLVSCPNYTFEIIAWLSTCIMTGSYAGQSSIALTPGTKFMAIFTFDSLAVPRCGELLHVYLGYQKAQKLQERIWKPIPEEEYNHPLHLLNKPLLNIDV